MAQIIGIRLWTQIGSRLGNEANPKVTEGKYFFPFRNNLSRSIHPRLAPRLAEMAVGVLPASEDRILTPGEGQRSIHAQRVRQFCAFPGLLGNRRGPFGH